MSATCKPISSSCSRPRFHSLTPISLQTPAFFNSPEKRRFLGQRKTMAEELIRLPVLASAGNVESFEEGSLSLSNGSSKFDSHVIAGGLEHTLNKMSKWLVTAVFGVAILWKHDAVALWAAMGFVLNAWLSIALKRVFNQGRPYSTSKSDPGMPSSHAQSGFFAVVYAILSMIKFLGVNEISGTFGVLALAFGSYLSWLRVSQKLHSLGQVFVGAIFGTIFSILWFQAWDAFVLNAFIASLWVRIFVVTGSLMLCAWFFIYVVRQWFR